MNKRIKKKAAQRVTNYWAKFVGKNIIRTGPTKNNDWSYTSNDPIKFLGMNQDGCIRYQHTGFDAVIFGTEECVLPKNFSDSNWILFSDAVKPQENNPLNKWIGKRIKRICPTEYGDRSYMCDMEISVPVTLIAATSTHVYIEYNDFPFEGERKLLNPRFAKTDDWVLAE